MARRKRWSGKRSSPDMGWVVGSSNCSVTYPNGDPDSEVGSALLFDFADIDPEALTGRIEADKSDWFIKRVLLNISGGAVLDGIGATDWVRMLTWGLSIADTTLINYTDSEEFQIFGPEWYNRQARILQTGLLPVYMPAVIPYAIETTSGDAKIATVDGSESIDSGWLGTAPFWGPSLQSHDISVSNAGLRNNQGLVFTIATADMGGSGYGWDAGDVANVRVFYQVLMQKRRGA